MNTNKHSKKVVHLPLFIQKNHKAILFSLLLFLMLPTTFVHAQRLYTTDGVNVRAKPNSSSKVLTSVSAGTSVTKTGRSGNWIAVKVNGIKGYIYKSYLSGSKNTSTATVSKSTSYRAVITASSVIVMAAHWPITVAAAAPVIPRAGIRPAPKIKITSNTILTTEPVPVSSAVIRSWIGYTMDNALSPSAEYFATKKLSAILYMD